MLEIEISKPSEKQLKQLGVETWPIWSKEISRFEWSYPSAETCYILQGSAKVETENGDVEFSKGDLVTFPAGLDCVWDIKEPIEKHYRLG